MNPEVHSFFHEDSNTVGHVVQEPDGRHCAIIDAALDYDQAAGRTRTDFADQIVAHRPRARARASTGSSRPTPMPTTCAPRPISSSSSAAASASASTSPTCRSCSGAVQRREDLQHRRLAVRPAVQGRRPLHGRRARGARAAHARPHARLHHLCDRRCRLRRRHAVHAGWRHGARRFPGRRRRDAVSLDRADPRAAARDPPVHVPRLRPGRPRHRLGDHGRRGAGQEHPRARRA